MTFNSTVVQENKQVANLTGQCPPGRLVPQRKNCGNQNLILFVLLRHWWIVKDDFRETSSNKKPVGRLRTSVLVFWTSGCLSSWWQCIAQNLIKGLEHSSHLSKSLSKFDPRSRPINPARGSVKSPNGGRQSNFWDIWCPGKASGGKDLGLINDKYCLKKFPFRTRWRRVPPPLDPRLVKP